MLDTDKIISHIYYLESNKESRESCVYIVSQLHYIMRDDLRIEKVSELLENINYQWLSSWSLIALLRTTYSIKSKIPSWEILYDFTKEYLDFNGFNTGKELHGLNL